MRKHIAAGTFGDFRKEFIANYVPSRRILSIRVKESLKTDDRG
jgi:hypothetical protein